MPEQLVQRANELAELAVFADCFGADLYPLARELRPMTAAPGELLMSQGEPADWFLIIGHGSVRIRHQEPEGTIVEADIDAGRIVGELALLRGSPRSATVIAGDGLSGWSGGKDAFSELIELPGVLDKLKRTARQRLAAAISPIPVTMRDGSELHVRPVLPGDSARTVGGPVEFSRETLYRRFQSMVNPTPSLMAYLFEVDYANHFVWVLTDGADGPVVADARFVREAHATLAEVAFIVGDDYQGRGIGTFSLGALAAAAKSLGVERFYAQVLADNMPMRKMLDNFGAAWHREDVGVVGATIDVPAPTALGLSAELARELGEVARRVVRVAG